MAAAGDNISGMARNQAALAAWAAARRSAASA